ncbi:MAG: hypothetical protein GY861_15975 [bacterium]|nr:hypothetical protein [bacterium]
MTEENNTEVAETTEEAPEGSESVETTATDSLLGDVEVQTDKLTDVPDHETKPVDDYDYPEGFFDDKGQVNKAGIKEFLGKNKEATEKYEERLLGMRRKMSDNKAPEGKEAYFQDFAPQDKYVKYFSEETPQGTKDTMKGITDRLTDMYHDSGLTTRQADDVSNSILEIMEEVGVLDTRSDEEKHIANAKRIEAEKRQLGSNAENIIRESKVFVEKSNMFSAKVKNKLLGMMESQGADFIDVIYQMKESSSGAAIPTSVANLSGLPSDVALKIEYLKPETTDLRRQEIMMLRERAGRSGRLMNAAV